MSRKEDNLEALEGWILIEASIECNKCKKGDCIDPDHPEEDAYEKGYREVGDEVLCKKCLKKEKSKKQQIIWQQKK